MFRMIPNVVQHIVPNAVIAISFLITIKRVVFGNEMSGTGVRTLKSTVVLTL